MLGPETSGFAPIPEGGDISTGLVWIDADEPGLYELDCTVAYASSANPEFRLFDTLPIYVRVLNALPW